jgi:signal transduction histidine kinase/DNA-binding response OmpR family regulator
MDATAPRFSLGTRLAVAGFAAAAIPVAILLAVHVVSDRPGLGMASVAGVGAWLLAGGALTLVARRLTAPLERLVAETADRADATRASLEQEVVARTVELSEARDRAEREARLKGVFLAAMSHEIRTPMNSIVGMAELMAETPLDGEQREYCDTIRTSTDALLGVINDILDFSRFEAQGVSLETLDFDLRLVVEDAVELLAVRASTTGIDLAAVIEPGFDGRFRGDPSRLRQVVVNLLGNAIKFTTRGSVVVRVTGLGSGLSSEPGQGPGATGVRMEVIDTGIGMTEEGVARLFRPFAQAEDSTSRHYGGTGLGLTITKQIVERMDGRIGVTSEPGRGSTFWIEIPFPRAIAMAPPARLARRVPDALVFEPLDASADALVRLLTELGVRATRVATAGDGLAALDARRGAFAVAFVSLDAIDATPFVDALQQHAAAGRTSVAAIVPAGRRGGADLDRLGAPDRLTRPIRRARLVECLDAISARVPAAAPDPVPAAPPSVDAPARAPRVLVADDYYANQRLVTRLLEKRGYSVEVVGDGQDAVAATLERPFDVVLMDCNMPRLDGYEATARIRALERGRRTPILAMTANDSIEDRDACLRAGMDGYLVKPIQAAIVLAAVDRWATIGRGQPAPIAADTAAFVPGGTR